MFFRCRTILILGLLCLSTSAFAQKSYPLDGVFVLVNSVVKPDTLGVEIFLLQESTKSSKRILNKRIAIDPNGTPEKITDFTFLGGRRFVVRTSKRQSFILEDAKHVKRILGGNHKAIAEWETSTVIGLGNNAEMDVLWTVDMFGNKKTILSRGWAMDSKFMQGSHYQDPFLKIQKIDKNKIAVLTKHRIILRDITMGQNEVWQLAEFNPNDGVFAQHTGTKVLELMDFIADDRGAFVRAKIGRSNLTSSTWVIFYFDFEEARKSGAQRAMGREVDYKNKITFLDIERGKTDRLLYRQGFDLHSMTPDGQKTYMGNQLWDLFRLKKTFGINFSLVSSNPSRDEILINHPRPSIPGLMIRPSFTNSGASTPKAVTSPSKASANSNTNTTSNSNRTISEAEKKQATVIEKAFKKQLRHTYSDTMTAKQLVKAVNTSLSLIYQFPNNTPEGIVDKFGIEIGVNQLFVVTGKENTTIKMEELFEFLAALEKGCNILLKP